MSAPAPSGTTYRALTAGAARHIGRAQVCLAIEGTTPDELAAAVALHGDLTAALAQLGSRLTGAGGRASSRGGLRRLLAALQHRAQPHDWDTQRPSTGPAAPISRAAVLIRAAADLWATHHTGAGGPRSPEASRLRHPATIGAARREWQVLITLTAGVAGALAGLAASHGHPTAQVTALATYPNPESPACGPAAVLDLPVARPTVHVGAPAPVELTDRVARLRHLAWCGSGGGLPATVHRNLAMLGASLHGSAATAHAAAAREAPTGPVAAEHTAAAARAERAAEEWQAAARSVAALRTPHNAAHPVLLERLSVERLLAAVLRSTASDAAADLLGGLADSFDEVARFSVEGLRASFRRGDLLIRGRALPAETVARRQDLVAARLRDEAVPIPGWILEAVVAAYGAISERNSGSEQAPAAGRRRALSPTA